MLSDVSFTLQQSVSKYKFKIKDGDKEIEEDVEIDTEKQTETYRIPKTDSGNAGDVDIVYDFKKVMKDTLVRQVQSVCGSITYLDCSRWTDIKD